MNGTIKITPAIKAEIARERARLELMRAHIVPTLRPVVIVARAGRARAISVFSQYRAEPVGTQLQIDGFDAAIVAAE